MIALTASEAGLLPDLTSLLGIAHPVYGLHMTLLWICVAIWVIVFGVMFYSIIAHRKSRGSTSTPFHDSTNVEMAWTILPFLILVVMAVPATRMLMHAQDGRQGEPVPNSRSTALNEQMRRGEYIYSQYCAMCHMPSGEGVPRAYPALKHSAIVTGPVPVLLDRVVNGKPGTSMTAFGVRLNDQELAAVSTYVRNAWGNDTRDAVQAIDVTRFKSAR